MNTIITNIPEKRKKWFLTLFNQFKVKYKILSAEAKEDLLLAKLIDEAMVEEGEVSKEKIYKFVKKHGA